MFDKLKSYVADHPEVVVYVAMLGVYLAAQNYAEAVMIAKNIHDLRASESLGG